MMVTCFADRCLLLQVREFSEQHEEKVCKETRESSARRGFEPEQNKHKKGFLKTTGLKSRKNMVVLFKPEKMIYFYKDCQRTVYEWILYIPFLKQSNV